MSARDVASLAYKLAGVYVLVQFVRLLPPILTAFAWPLEQDSGPTINVPLLVLGHVIPIVLMASLGFLLILKSRSLAERTIGDSAQPSVGLWGSEIHAILFSVIGVLLIGIAAPSIPRVFHNLAVLLADYDQPGYQERRADYLRDSWLWLTGIGLQLIIGGVLLFRAQQLVSVLRRTSRSANVVKNQCPHCGHPFKLSDYRSDAEQALCSHCKRELPREAVKKGV